MSLAFDLPLEHDYHHVPIPHDLPAHCGNCWELPAGVCECGGAG